MSSDQDAHRRAWSFAMDYRKENKWLRKHIEAAKKTLPPDPDLNAPWSQCIAILDEALASENCDKWNVDG